MIAFRDTNQDIYREYEEYQEFEGYYDDQPAIDKVIKTKGAESKDDGRYMEDMKVRMAGNKNEMETTDLFEKFLKTTEPKVIISQFHWQKFCGLFRNYTCHPKGRSQEIDHVMILGEYSTVLMLEVKSNDEYRKSFEKSLQVLKSTFFYRCFIKKNIHCSYIRMYDY